MAHGRSAVRTSAGEDESVLGLGQGDVGTTVWIYLMPRNGALKNQSMQILCIFYCNQFFFKVKTKKITF